MDFKLNIFGDSIPLRKKVLLENSTYELFEEISDLYANNKLKNILFPYVDFTHFVIGKLIGTKFDFNNNECYLYVEFEDMPDVIQLTENGTIKITRFDNGEIAFLSY